MLAAIALLGGFSVLVIEILGIHLLAPWFGTSTLIWSQQIAIIMLAMAVGGWFGGNIARTKTNLILRLSTALFIASAFFVLLSFGISVFAEFVLPSDLSLDEVAGIFQLGSFLAAAMFFAPPVFFLSWLTPILVELSVEGGVNAGQSSGRLGAIATAGSLLGIYFSTFIAIPFLGVRESILCVAGLLAICSILLRAKKKYLALVPLVLTPLIGDDASALANMPNSATLVEVADTSYQRLRVIDFDGQERWLQMNEGLDSYQSKWQPQQGWPGGYYDLFALLPYYFQHFDSATAKNANYCILGYGAGSALMPLSIAHPEGDWQAVGVELDPQVLRLANSHMPLPKEFDNHLTVHTGIDARAALRFMQADFDAIIIDAYSRQFEVPLHLATHDFFVEAYDKLNEGGVLCFNLGTTATALNDSTLAAISAGIVKTFGISNVRLQHVARSRNWVLFARKNMVLPSVESLAKVLPSGWPLEVGASCLPAECLEAAELSSITIPPLTDNLSSLATKQISEW